MDTTPSVTRDSQPRAASRRRWLRFSLRTFLIVCTLLAIGFGWLGSILVRVRHQQRVIAELKAEHALMWYEDMDESDSWTPRKWILRPIVEEEALRDVVGVFFAHGRVSDAQLARLVELPKLKYVSAPGEDILGKVITDAGIEHLSRVKDLESLSLTTDQPLSGRGLARLASAKNLGELDLGGPGITDQTIQFIDELQSVRTLDLTETNFTSSGLEPLSRLTRLEELNLARNPAINDNVMQHLAALPNLRTLSLEECSVSDAAMEAVGTLPHLRSLNLADTDVSNQGAAALTGLKHLEELSLRSTAVTNEATRHVGKLKRLRQLNLYGTAVTDAGLLSLGDLVELETLVLGPSVTAEAARALKTHLPKCHIEGLDPGGVNTFVLPAQ